MAEKSILAFGRYLRALRERRGCSLDEVASLSQTFPEKINKGYLSRCENGRQKLAFSKVIALSRIYEVPADVLVERMELDLELDRVGGPETEGMSFAELTEAGKRALRSGHFWNAYGYLRDAILPARLDPVRSNLSDRNEQVSLSVMNCGSSARALGRFRFALHEFRFLEALGSFGPLHAPLILERISACCCAVKEFETAERYAQRAIDSARDAGANEYLGFLLSCRARVALSQSDYKTARAFYQQAHRVHKRAGQLIECAQALNCIAQCYFETRRLSSARRAAEAAARIATAQDRPRSFALSQVLLGELDEIENKHDSARKRWANAVEIAKGNNDRELRFKVEFVRYRHALKIHDQPVARATERRLHRLAPWLPADTQELLEFSDLTRPKASQP